MTTSRQWLCAGAMAMAGLASGTVAAQAVLEEITVTAQKREQSLQDVGITVSAFSVEEMKSYGFSNASDIVSRVPSLDNYSTYGPGSSANITVRGIGLNDFGEGHEAPVTTYVDELYLVSVPAIDFALYDLERVEVLRGPQGTLFGRNSTGGLIHYVTAKPTRETTGFLSLGGGRFGEIKAEGAIGGSVSETVSGRLSFLAHHSDGFIENLNPQFDEDGGQAGTNAFRGQVMFEPSEDLRISLKGEYADIDKIHTYYQQVPAVADPATGLFSLAPNGTDFAGYNEANFGAGARDVTRTSSPSSMQQDGYSLLARIEKDFGDVTLTSLTGYVTLDRQLEEDCDASPNVICVADFPYETDWVTQEIRLSEAVGAFRWTAGFYFLHQDATNNPSATFNVPVGGPGAVDPATGLYNGPLFPIALAANWEQQTDTYSLFGQAEYDFAERWTFIAGLRLGHDEKDFTDSDNATLRSCPGFPIPSNCFLPPTGPGIANPYTNTYDEDLVSWKVELDFRPTDDVLLFGSISQGTKAGGFNNGFYSPAASNLGLIPYGNETNLAYELGEKSVWFEGRLRVNASMFYYDYSNYQTFNWQGIGGLIINRDASAYGAEIEAEALVTEQLTARVGFGVLETEIEDVTGRASTFTADRDMSNAPGTSANGALVYAVPVRSNYSLTLQWDWNYAAERYTNNFNDPASELESYFKHNASVVIGYGENWQLAGYVRNISDELNESKVFVFSDLGYAQTIYAQPRTFGATLTYSF